MEECMKDSKKNLEQFLKERLEWFINYGNPFQEATMVSYINNGLKKLHELNTTNDKQIIMYDNNSELCFKMED